MYDITHMMYDSVIFILQQGWQPWPKYGGFCFYREIFTNFIEINRVNDIPT